MIGVVLEDCTGPTSAAKIDVANVAVKALRNNRRQPAANNEWRTVAISIL
jgi:hypothetical protein